MTAGDREPREVLSRLLSGRRRTRLVLRRDATGLTTGQLVRSAGETYRVQGTIRHNGDVVLSPVLLATPSTPSFDDALAAICAGASYSIEGVTLTVNGIALAITGDEFRRACAALAEDYGPDDALIRLATSSDSFDRPRPCETYVDDQASGEILTEGTGKSSRRP